MLSTILEKKQEITNKEFVINFGDEVNFSPEEDKFIKSKLKEIDDYYKTHEFIGIPVEEAYLNGIKKLSFKYEL